MKKTCRFFVIMITASTIMYLGGAAAADSKAPDIVPGAMMMEHVGMGCTNCHGDNGPAGVNMKNHPGQQCTDCHEEGTMQVKAVRKTKSAKGEAPPLGIMMMEHENMNCTNCHGEKGPAGVNMKNHPGQECTDCHKLDK